MNRGIPFDERSHQCVPVPEFGHAAKLPPNVVLSRWWQAVGEDPSNCDEPVVASRRYTIPTLHTPVKSILFILRWHELPVVEFSEVPTATTVRLPAT